MLDALQNLIESFRVPCYRVRKSETDDRLYFDLNGRVKVAIQNTPYSVIIR